MGTMLIRQFDGRSVSSGWPFSIALLGLVAINFLGPKLGYEIFVIRGGSMAPAIPLGALVATEPVNAGTFAVGEIVSVRGPNGVVYTHRIVAIDTAVPSSISSFGAMPTRRRMQRSCRLRPWSGESPSLLPRSASSSR